MIKTAFAIMFITCSATLSMVCFRSSIAKRHSSLQQKALGSQDRRQAAWSTIARRGKLGGVLAGRKCLKKIMFMARSAEGAAEPALL
jgi:hypothetical protein